MIVRSLSPAAPCRPHFGAFTLVEMVVTLSVFILLSAAIFGIITGVLRSASSLQENQNRGDQGMALNAFLRSKLGGLPAQSVMISYRRGDGEGLDQNGIIFGTSGLLTAIDAKIQPNGLYSLRVATFSPGPANSDPVDLFEGLVTSNDSSLAWTGLIRDLKHIDWKFEDSYGDPWADLWTAVNGKPTLVEFSMQIAGDVRPSVMDFWIPPLVAPTTLSGLSGSATNPTGATNAP
jgi:type II secretory pathway pseudopilin PulG